MRRLDTFTKNNIIMFCASSLGSFFNLLYQVMMLRLLYKEAFASLNSIISLFIIVGVPSAAFATIVTKHVSSHNAQKKHECVKTVWQKMAFHAFLFSSILFGILFLMRERIAGFLHLGSSVSIMILGAIFLLSVITSVAMGGLQGLEKFAWVALYTVFAGICKLLFSVVLVKSVSDGLIAALLGFLLPLIVGLGVCLWPIRFLMKGLGRETISLKSLYAYIVPVLAVNLSFALLTNIDMILVKHFFVYESQDYAIAQMIGKIILSIAGVIYVVMFARISHLHAVNESSKAVLSKSLGYTFLLSGAAMLLYNIFPQAVFGLIAGKVNLQVISIGRIFSLSMLFFAMSNVLFYYQLSIERYGFIVPLGIVVFLETLAISIFHATPFLVVTITLVSAASLFFLNLKLAFQQAR